MGEEPGMPSEDDRTWLVATRCRQKGPGDSAYSNALGRANVDRQEDLLERLAPARLAGADTVAKYMK